MRSFILLSACLFKGLLVIAQPANDNPCNATIVSPVYTPDLTCAATSGGFSYTVATASYFPAPPCYSSGTINDVWFQFTAAASARVAVKIASPSDGVMTVYKGSCSVPETSSNVVACNDDTLGSLNPQCMFDVAEGETYLIRYWVIGSAAATVSGMCIVTDAPPASASQRVGIGIANPQANLDVNGTIQIRGGNPEEGYVLTCNAQGKANWRKVNNSIKPPLYFTSDLFATPTITVNHTGFASTALLATAGLTSDHYNDFAALTASSKDQIALSVHSDQNNGANIFNYNGNNASLLVANLDTTYSNPLAADFSGSIKIRKPYNGSWLGVNSGNLDVEGGVGINASANSYTALQFDNSLGNKISLWGYAPYGAHYGIGIQNNLLQLYTSNAGADVAIGYGNSTAFTENMRIKGSGNVGIGTNSPGRKFEVVATGTNVITIASKSAFGAAGVEFVSDHGLTSQWRPAFIQSNDLGNFTGRLEFFTNGTGAANAYGAVKGLEIRNGTTLTATGTVGSYSDSRLKSNIQPFTDGLNIIRQVQPVTFRYNANAPFPSNDEQVGILAQELEKVAPYMVKQTSESGYNDLRWVNNQAYTFLLINAVKEQQLELDALKKEILELKARLETLTPKTK